MHDTPRSRLIRHAVAVPAVALAAVARLALDPLLGEPYPIATLFIAILIVAGYGGRGPALLTTALGAVVAARFLVPPRAGFALLGAENRAGLVVYLAVGIGIAILGGSMRSARRRAEANEAEAVEQREWLRVTMTSLGDAVIATDGRGRVRFMNPIAERITGWTREESEGRPIEDVLKVVDDPDRQPALHPVARVIRDGLVDGQAHPSRMVTRDGTETAIEDTAAPIKDASGKLVGVVLVFQDVTERRRHEVALSQSEARHRTILESITDAFFALGRDWRFTYVNGQAESLLGRSREDLIGKVLWEQYPETVGNDIERRFRRAMDQGEVVQFEEFYPPHRRWYENHIYPARDGLSVYFRDITERRRSHEELRTRDERLRLATEATGLGIWDFDPRTGVVVTSDFGKAAFGLAPGEELTYETFLSSVPPDDRGRVHRANQEAMGGADGGRYSIEYPVVGRSDGVFRWLEARGQAYFDHEGRVIRFLGTLLDVTERKRVEADRQMFASLVENSGDFIAVFGFDGRPSFMNEAGMRMVGLESSDRMRATSIRDYFFPEDREFLLEEFLPAVRREGRGEVEVRFRHFGTGGPLWMIYNVVVICNADGEPSGFATVSRDITERKRVEDEVRAAREEAEHASNAKTQFLAVLSHELRTPLNPILLAASSMLERSIPPEEVRPTLEMIRQNVNLQARLIDDLLDVMRIVRGKMPLQWEVADGHELIRQALQICRSEVLGKDLQMELDLSAHERHINADPARFQQVIWNLVKNSVKFTPERGTIVIRSRNDGEGRLVIEVSDTGIGIEPGMLSLIFDTFQQGESRITRKYGGLGLGLAICRSIVESHGGTLTAESEGIDRGATFRITLATIPSPAEDVDSSPEETPDGPGPVPSQLRILVVEDEISTLQLMARLLRRLGHEVTTAGTITAGFEAFEVGAHDLIVSDIGLPDGTGLDLMRRVVAAQGKVPSIALTGYGMEEDIRRSREVGFTAHMTKPIDFTKLEALIRQIVR